MDEARTSLDKLKALAPHVPEGQLVARFGRHPAYPARIRDGLKLALAPPH